MTDIAGFTHRVTAINKGATRTINVPLTRPNPAPSGGLPLRIPALPSFVSGVNFGFTEYGNGFTIMPEYGLEYTFTIDIEDDEFVEGRQDYDLVFHEGEGFTDSLGALSLTTSKLLVNALFHRIFRPPKFRLPISVLHVLYRWYKPTGQRPLIRETGASAGIAGNKVESDMKVLQVERREVRAENEATIDKNESAVDRLLASNERLRADMERRNAIIDERGAKMEKHSKELIKFIATMTGLIIVSLSVILGGLIVFLQYFK